MKDLTIVILAGGSETRMNSTVPKSCHKIGDMTIIERILKTAQELDPVNIILVVNKDNIEPIRKVLQDYTDIRIKIQYEPLGTAHAVMSAYPCCTQDNTHLLVLLGDTPFIKPNSLEKVIRSKFDVVIMGFKNPSLDTNYNNDNNYDRIVIQNNRVKKVIPFNQCNSEEKKIKICDSGILWLHKKHIPLIWKIQPYKGKYNLTDIIHTLGEKGLHIGYLETKMEECIDINTQEDLAKVNKNLIK